jgi:hypothetical protein
LALTPKKPSAAKDNETAYDPSTAARIEAAIVRLKAGKPSNTDLKKQQRAGKFKVNISSVAKEAGVSRTLIGHKNCAYPAQRKRVLGLRGNEPAQGTLMATVRKLRAEVVEAKSRERLDASLRAALLRRIFNADKAVRRAERKSKRSISRTTSGHIGKGIPESNVIDFDKGPDEQ